MSFFNHLRPEPPDSPKRESISLEQATRLLSIGVVGPRRPVDDLIDRIRRDAGGHWFDRTVDTGLRVAIGRGAGDLIAGRLTLDELLAAKESAKRVMHGSAGAGEAAAATALYFIAVAAALAHEGECITSRGRETLAPILIDLADAAPTHWRALLELALER